MLREIMKHEGTRNGYERGSVFMGSVIVKVPAGKGTTWDKRDNHPERWKEQHLVLTQSWEWHQPDSSASLRK